MTEPSDRRGRAATSEQRAVSGRKPNPISNEAGWVVAVANALRDVAVALSDGFRNSPGLSALVLLFLLVAVVAGIALYFVSSLVGLVVFLAFLVVGVIFAAMVYRRSIEQSAERFGVVKEVRAMNTLAYGDRLSSEQREIVGGLLESMAAGIADDLDIDPSSVRANVFGIGDDGRLHIVPGLTWNMAPGKELSVAMSAGSGSTGRCFATGVPNIAMRRATGAGWGADILPTSEMEKLHRDLSWIVSIPIVIGHSDARPVWILNADGLVPVEQSRLNAIAPSLLYWAEALSLILRTNLEDQQ